MVKKFYVYALRVQGKRKPFYIGKGTGRRAQVHLSPNELKKKSHKSHTILAAQAAGKEILIDYLSTNLSEAAALAVESIYIEKYGTRLLGTGCLTNQCDSEFGGSSGYKHSAKALEKIAKAATGRVYSEVTRQKLRDAALRQVRKPVTEETRAKLRAARAKRVMGPMSEEQKEKIRQTLTGRTQSPEAIAKSAAARTGATRSDETRRRISEAQKGNKRGPMPEEWKEKISKALTGRPRSQETKNKISTSQKARLSKKGK